MNKSTSLSLILAALVATSGFAMAQSPAADATKGEMSAPVPPKTGMGNTRAEVKADIPGKNPMPRTQGEAVAPHPVTGPGTPNTRADVKAQIGGNLKAATQGESSAGVATTGTPSMSSAERKAKRAERRAAARAKRAAMAPATTPAKVD